MTEEQITANKDFWQKSFGVSSIMFPLCHLLALFIIKSALPFFIVLGVTLTITIFISVKYYRAQTAYLEFLIKKNHSERRAALLERLEP